MYKDKEHKLTKITIGNVAQVALSMLMFVVVIDPTNTIFHLKELCFVAVLGVAFLDYHNLNIQPKIFIIISLIFAVFVFSLVMGNINGYDFADGAAFGFFKSFLFLFLLLIVGDSNFDFFKALTLPAITISIIVIIAFIAILFFPEIGSAIYLFALEKDQTIMMSMRNFLGLDVQSVFYKSSPVLVIPLAYYFNLWLTSKKKRASRLVMSLLFLAAVLMSGTRANMLSGVMIVVVLFVNKLSKKKIGVALLLPVATVVIFASSFLVYKLLTDNEKSSDIKGALADNLTEQILSNSDIIIFGQGAGSTYDSSSLAHGITSISELSYLEIFRMFGLIGGSVVIVLFLYPLFLMIHSKPPNYGAFLLGYVAYLFIGGTNPLLIGSTGFMVLAIAYSYALTYNNKLSCLQ